MIELYQFPQLSKYLRRGISDQLVMELLDKELNNFEIRPLLLHFKDREGNKLISSWFQKVSESNNGLFLTSLFCLQDHIDNSSEAASSIFDQIRTIDGRKPGLESFPGSITSYFRILPDWIGDKGLWLVLVDHVEQLDQAGSSLQKLGLPVIQSNNVRLIYTTSSNETATKFSNSSVRVVDVTGHSGHLENSFINTVLKSAGLKLPEEIVSLIATKKGADNPAFIRLLAQKLRIHGISEQSLSIINEMDLSTESE